MSRFSPELNGLKRKGREDENPYKEHNSDEEKQEQSSKKAKLSITAEQLASRLNCPVCTEVKDSSEMRIPNCCFVMCCNNCFIQCMSGEIGQRKLKCPHCRETHQLHDSTRLKTDQELIHDKCKSYQTMLERNNITVAQPPAAVHTERCSQDCPRRAAYHCTHKSCGNLCDNHSTQLHPRHQNDTSPGHTSKLVERHTHTVTLIDDKTPSSQKEAAEFLRRRDAVKATSKGIEESRAGLPSLEGEVNARMKQLNKDKKFCKKHKKQIKRMERRIALEKASIQREVELAADSRKTYTAKLETRLAELQSFIGDPMTLSEEDFGKLCNMRKIQKEHKSHLRDWQIHVDRLKLRSTPSVVKPLMDQLNAATLLPEAESGERNDLEGFLPGGVNLDDAQLLYKMSRDGSCAEDFFRLCCEKGRLLIFVKVAGSGNLFGVFINDSLPQPPADGSEVIVPDPTGQSFIFLLSNHSDITLKLELKSADKHRAFGLGDRGLYVGAEEMVNGETVKYSSLALFGDGKPADIEGANFVNSHSGEDAEVDDFAYEVDESSANDRPGTYRCDENLIAGSGDYFAAAEIEVYTI